MASQHRHRHSVLVLEDVRETATLMRSMLTVSGFSVALAADEQDAIRCARTDAPDLIVISLAGSTDQILAVATRIRQEAGISKRVPVVIFCVPTIPEGSEVEIEPQTYLARLQDFNQLRTMLGRLLSAGSEA